MMVALRHRPCLKNIILVDEVIRDSLRFIRKQMMANFPGLDGERSANTFEVTLGNFLLTVLLLSRGHEHLSFDGYSSL